MNIGFIGQESSYPNRSVAEFIDGDGIDTEGITRIGTVVFDSLQSDRFERARIFTAFARASGVRQLERTLEAAEIDVELVVGIDHENTSREALERLADLPIDSRLYYHPQITYHPKIYYFDGPELSRVLVGSSNLTNQGLNQNIEAAMVFETAGEASAAIDDATSFLDTIASEATDLDYDVIDQYADLLGTEGSYTGSNGGPITGAESSHRASIPDEMTANTSVQSRSPALPSDDERTAAKSDDTEPDGAESDSARSNDSSFIDRDRLPPRSEMPPIRTVSEFSTTTDENYYRQLVNDPENQPSLLRRYIRASGEVSRTELERVASQEWGYSLSGSFGASLHVLTDVIDEVDTARKNGETYYIWKK